MQKMERTVKDMNITAWLLKIANNFRISEFFSWMYNESGGDEYPEHAALGVLILWTTW